MKLDEISKKKKEKKTTLIRALRVIESNGVLKYQTEKRLLRFASVFLVSMLGESHKRAIGILVVLEK